MFGSGKPRKPWLFLIKGSNMATFQEHFPINILLTNSIEEVMAFATIDIGKAFDRLVTSLEPFPRIELCDKKVEFKCVQLEDSKVQKRTTGKNSGTSVGTIQLRIILTVYDKCVISALQQYTATWQAQTGEVMMRNVLRTVLGFAQRLIFALKYFLFIPKTRQLEDLQVRMKEERVQNTRKVKDSGVV
ncbi:hypothetical protein WDU94_011245 [Cyamophila willieti]